jgi:hypothetical protein
VAAPPAALGTRRVARRFCDRVCGARRPRLKNVQPWADMIDERPAVKPGRMVNRTSGETSSQLHERHDASEIRGQNDIALSI